MGAEFVEDAEIVEDAEVVQDSDLDAPTLLRADLSLDAPTLVKGGIRAPQAESPAPPGAVVPPKVPGGAPAAGGLPPPPPRASAPSVPGASGPPLPPMPAAASAPSAAKAVQPAPSAGGVLHTPLDWKPPPPPDSVSAEQSAREIVAQCESLIETTKDSARKGRLHYECARLLETPLGDLKRASEHYLKSREYLGDHIPTLRGTRRVLLLENNAKASLPLFDAEVRLTKSAARKAVLLYEKGRLLSMPRADWMRPK